MGTIFQSWRGKEARWPARAFIANPTSAPPQKRKVISHSGGIRSTPMAMIGQLKPRLSTTEPNSR